MCTKFTVKGKDPANIYLFKVNNGGIGKGVKYV